MKESPAVLWVLAGLAAIAFLIAFADRPINAWVAGLDGALFEAYRAINQIGNSRWYLVSLPVLIAVLLWLRRRAGGEKGLVLDGLAGIAGFLFGAVAVSGIAVNLPKVLIGRARPKLWDQDGIYGLSPFSFDHDYQGFPSGHATTLFALAAAIGLLAPRWRVPLYVIAAVFALTRVAVNAHYPSDIIGGAMLGIASSLLLARWLARRGLLFREEPGGYLRPGPAAAIAVGRLTGENAQTRNAGM